ncbi:MAG TPA: serine protease [Verrucomicrobiae bacterium]|nr:serine protease [Verrucomicrobiae bacterium]
MRLPVHALAIIFTVLVPTHADVVSPVGSLPTPDAGLFPGTEAVSSNLVRSVFVVQVPADASNEWDTIGSGFFVGGVPTTGRTAVIGVTCDHVVAAAAKLEKLLYTGINTGNGFHRSRCRVLYTDPSNDIAVISPVHAATENSEVENLPIPLEIFDNGSALAEGKGVLIAGYPLALGTENDRNHPIIRFGMIAQNPGGSVFLIDGTASHGNSGSPVVTLGSDYNRLAGMITSIVTDRITLFDEKGGLTADFPYNAGLARAVRASLILDAVRQAEKRLSE